MLRRVRTRYLIVGGGKDQRKMSECSASGPRASIEMLVVKTASFILSFFPVARKVGHDDEDEKDEEDEGNGD